VISEPILVDTGPLVAMLHRGDRNRSFYLELAKEFEGPVYSCWSVVTEAAWLVRNLPNGLERLLDLIAMGDVALLDLDSAAAGWMNRCRATYSDLRPQLADLSLLYLAQRDEIRHIFTLDRRDFAVYRDIAGQAFQLIPANI
jgi:predicted nucleic acid-binding protein